MLRKGNALLIRSSAPRFCLSAAQKSNASHCSTDRRRVIFGGMKAMGQRHLRILRGHRSPEAHASDRGISPGSTGHSRSLGVALPVPHDESVTAFAREGDRLHQLREMGVGGVARSAAGRKPSRTTCRYHLNTSPDQHALAKTQ